MAAVEKMSIALTQEMAKEVRLAVERGEYASASEVIRDALRDWQHKRALVEQELEELRRAWREGLESGTGRYESMEAIKQAAKSRHDKGLS